MPDPKTDIKKRTYLLILLISATAVGIYLLFSCVIISKDGVTFIEYAKILANQPVNAMLKYAQHPGYPFLILIVNKFTSLTFAANSFQGWVYSAQIAALLSRLAALTILYYIGSIIVGQVRSFLALFILILLAKPAGYGADALSDWPSMAFLAAAIFVLLSATHNRKRWQFVLAGILTGLGYLIRPECIIAVLLGQAYLLVEFLKEKKWVQRGKIISCAAILLLSFVIIAGPYMKLKGAVFPKKNLFNLTVLKDTLEHNTAYVQQAGLCNVDTGRIINATSEIIGSFGEMVMWIFLVPIVLGGYQWFNSAHQDKSTKFVIASFVLFYVCILLGLYLNYGYVSQRHNLPLVCITIFFVPDGLEIIAEWLKNGLSKIPGIKSKNENFLFSILFIASVIFCVPKLLKPVNYDKLAYRQAIDWLKQNTLPQATIAVPDIRLSFYSQRKGLVYEKDKFSMALIPPSAQYIVGTCDIKGRIPFDANKGDLLFLSSLAHQTNLFILANPNFSGQPAGKETTGR